MKAKTQRTAEVARPQHLGPFFGLVAALCALFVLATSPLAASNRHNASTSEPISADSLFQHSPTDLTPCSDWLFLAPTQTTVAAPSQNGRTLSRSHSSTHFSSQFDTKNGISSSRGSNCQKNIPHHRPGRIAFARVADFYVYFLNVLRL